MLLLLGSQGVSPARQFSICERGRAGTWGGKRGQEFQMLNLAIVQFEERTFQNGKSFQSL